MFALKSLPALSLQSGQFGTVAEVRLTTTRTLPGAISPLVTGADVIALGVPSGPRVGQLLRQVNMVLAAYTRAQALSALIVGVICGVGFALMKLPNAAMFGIVAGLLETIPIAGPLAVAISATSVASPSQVLLVLAFLGALRVLQDYVIYPRLIRQALHLHPIGVVLAIWFGAMAGGVVGVCLAVPTVGVLQVAWRQYQIGRAHV